MAFDFKKNKAWVIGGIAGVAIVGYLYVKNRGSSTASASTTSGSSAIDPLTGMPVSMDNQVDPVTGMTYLQEAQQYGSVQAAQQAISSGSAYSSSIYGSGYGGYGGYGYGTSGYPTINGINGQPAVGTNFASNAAWAQAVTSGLVALGYNSQDVATALGLFFAQHPLGTAADGVSYASIVQAAEAEYGPPPQGTYAIIPEPTNNNPPPTTPGQITVPNVTGEQASTAIANLQAAGLKSKVFEKRTSGVTYTVSSQTPAAGTSVAAGTVIGLHVVPAANPGGPNQPAPPPATPGTSVLTIMRNQYFNPGDKDPVTGQTFPVINAPPGGASVPWTDSAGNVFMGSIGTAKGPGFGSGGAPAGEYHLWTANSGPNIYVITGAAGGGTRKQPTVGQGA